ncbi:MAG TPA: DNA internalization-related competence protein ComEC/Rec2, partial [Bacillota bacterium]|nr:DNA internalization-related competence protein ComEC/Rec2 [Bacillota bacterium]
QLHGSVVGRLAEERAVVAAEVRVDGDPHRIDGRHGAMVLVPARVQRLEGRGHRWATAVPVLLVADADSSLRHATVGSRWRLTTQLSSPDPGDSVAAFADVLDADLLEPPHPGWQLVERVRDGLRRSVAERPPGPRALVPALVVGDISAMPPHLQELFRTTGLTHLTAVSGANLTLLLGFVLVMVRWLGVRGRWLTVTGLLTVAVFVALCRTEPSVLRATAMGLVALAAVGHGGTTGTGGRGLRHLCIAVIALLVVDPWLGRSVGFALSTLATAGILVWAGGWARRLCWTPRVVAEGIAVPLAAQLATQPVVSAISGQLSLVGLLANALAGPLVGPATVAGFAAAGLSQLHPLLGSVAGWLASWPAQGIIWIAELTGALPGAAVRVPATPVAVAGLAVAVPVAAWWTSRMLSRPWACGAIALTLVVVLLRAPAPPGWPPAQWSLVMCDVGQGDAAVVRIAPRTAIVVDTGPDPADLTRCLDQLGIRRTPMVVLTHYHADHVGGLGALLDDHGVDLVLTSPTPVPADTARAVTAALDARGIRHRPSTAGDSITIGATRWETLWPTRAAARGTWAINDTSVVGRLTAQDGMTVLFTGDLEPTGQASLLGLGTDLRAMVLKVPHHGSADQDPGFLAAVGARWAITSAGEDNSYGHPSPRTIRALHGLGMGVLRTDTSGAVAIGADDGRWVVRTQR